MDWRDRGYGYPSRNRIMKLFEPIENELQRRDQGWWDRVVQAIPELASLVGTPQPPRYHGEGDVAEHTRLAVDACPPHCDPDLLWAALLHDVGKSMVTKVQSDKITAHGHNAIGAEMAEKILIRLQMDDYRRNRIVWAIKHHAFHLSWNLTSPEQASKRQRRFVADPRFPFLLELLRIDTIASLGHPRGLEAYDLYIRLRETVISEGPG